MALFGVFDIINIMNEFSAKKLGEVLAFATVSLDTLKQGEVALQEAFGIDLTNELTQKNQGHIETINQIAEKYDATGIVNKKLEGTGTKLKRMRDTYIGDAWDNPTELLEWSGFFEGAAIVHWVLVAGLAETLNDQKIKNLANDALKLHRQLFEIAETKLNQHGKEQSV